MPNRSAKNGIAFFLFCILPGSLAFGQTASLNLSSGSAVEGGSVSLNLSLSGGGAPAGLQWALSFSPGDVSSVTVTAGSALAALNKTLTCNSVSGSVTCLTDGMNDATIGNCVVATITVTLSPFTSGATVPVAVSNPMGAFGVGSAETISATAGAVTVQNWQPGLSSLVCSPTSLNPGAISTCTVTLAQAAPSGGSLVSLSSNNTALPVAASVTVPAGATSAPFTATAGAITANQSATLTAILNLVSATANISLVAPVQVSSLSCSPASLGPNSSGTCTVTLNQAALTGGASVVLSSNVSALTVPESVTVAAGSTTNTFSATSGTISSNQTATVTATYNTSATANISLVAPVQVSSLSCSPASLGQNSSSTCSVTLNQAALAGGASVVLSSNVSALTVPVSVTVAAGSTTNTFSATSGALSSNQTATVTATYNTSATASISLSVLAQVSSLSCSPISLGQNSSSTCTITLTQAAPAGGASVALSSNAPALSVPASVMVAAGAVSATFSATSGTVPNNQEATVTATYNSSATAVICLKAPVLVSSLSCSPASIGQNSSTSCTVTLTQAAPCGGASVTLSSSTAVLSVPATVTVAAGATMATFSASSSTAPSNQTATVTATYSSTSATATISVTGSVQAASLSCSPTSLGQNSSGTCTVMLNQSAPGSATVTLSSNAAALTVPASVTVAAGSTTATFTATSGTISSNQTAIVTATYNGSATASIGLAAAATPSSLGLSSGTAVEGSSASLSLSLTGSTTAAGLQWTLAFVPSDASVTVTPGTALSSASKTLSCNSISGAVTCLTAGMNDSLIGSGVVATVTVTLSPVTSGANVPIVVTNPMAALANGSAAAMAAMSGAVTVQNWQPTLSSLQCSPTSVNAGANATCTVTLAQAAPSGGTVVSLSSNSTMLPVAASVTVPAGSMAATSTATAGHCGSNQTATVTATLNSAAKTASVSLVAPVQVSSLACTPAALGKNSTGTCTITMTQDAPSGGATVTLSSNTAALTVPATVSVLAGASTATFNATTGTISSNQTATVTATYNNGPATASINLEAAAFVSSISCSPAALTSAASATCTVNVANGSQGSVTLASSNPLLTLPASLTLKLVHGGLTGSFTATAGQIAASQTAIVTASLNGTTQSATVTLNSSAQQASSQVRPLSLSCTPNTLPAQSTGLCSVTLSTGTDGPAAQVRLSSSSASLRLPAAIATHPGQTNVQFQIDSAASLKDESAVISAQLNAETVQQTVSLRRSNDLAVVVPASQVARFGSELRFRVSAADQSATFAAGTLPPGAIFDGAAGVFDWTPSASQQGKYRLAFTATNSVGETGTAYSAVQVDAGEPTVDRVVNAASGSVQGACSPGAIARIEGRWLTQGESAADPSGGSLELAGTSVEIEGKAAPILDASASRIDILCPDAGPASSFALVVRTAGLVSQPFETIESAAAPGIFTVDGSGSGQGLVSLAGESKLAMVRNYLSAAEPARAGDRIAILATGIGAASNVLVRIGEVKLPAESVEAVAGRPGVWQITAVLPDDAAAGISVPLVIVGQLPDGSQVRSNSVSVAIEEK